MRLLYDAVLPQSLAYEAPAGMELQRWDGDDESDADLVSASAERDCRGLILWGRDSLQQADLRRIARTAGVALVAVDADSPVEAKQRILKNLSAMRRELEVHDCLLVLASEVRPMDDVTHHRPDA